MRKTSEILEIMRIFEQENPNPQCELHFHNPYTLLVAVMLSAQSTDKGVNKATEALFKIADTPQKMLNLGLDKLKDYILSHCKIDEDMYNKVERREFWMDADDMLKYGIVDAIENN